MARLNILLQYKYNLLAQHWANDADICPALNPANTRRWPNIGLMSKYIIMTLSIYNMYQMYSEQTNLPINEITHLEI